jgi:hypothetical protein
MTQALQRMEQSVVDVELVPRSQGAMIPKGIAELQTLANLMYASGLMPSSIKSPEAVAVAVMAGLEVGISPMSAVQNIAVINGRPAIWGDAMLAIVQASGLMEDFSEEPLLDAAGNVVGYRCRAIRRGQATPIEDTFTMEDARKAKLDKKSGPWTDYPARMLRLRARGFVLRNGFADVLRGMISAEEASDIPTTTNRALEREPIATPKPAGNGNRQPVIQPRPSGQDDGASSSGDQVRGVVEKVTVKTGTGKKGPWTKHGVLVNGEWFGTFDTTIGEDANILSGREVVITWKPDGDYKTLLSIRSVDMVDAATAPREREPGEEG